ncbi:MAG: hypothetical protein HRT71_12125 [Flavobacteriales bacterium]|nr:hypothetical protein [Flavobacteriales bacterium]
METIDPLQVLAESLKKYLAEINSLRNLNSDQEKNIVNLESDLRRIKGDLSSKNTVVLSLKSAAITNKKIISDLERTLEKRKKEVASQITTNERIVLELGNLKESMQKSDKEINKLKATKEEKQKKKENV